MIVPRGRQIRAGSVQEMDDMDPYHQFKKTISLKMIDSISLNLDDQFKNTIYIPLNLSSLYTIYIVINH